jgi:2-iminobutanoate/2-iminopropanoate deaminase
MELMIRTVDTEEAPKPIGPYSQAVVCNGFVFCSGQLGIDPASGELVLGGVTDEAERALKNLEVVLRAAGSSLQRVVRVTLYLRSMEDFKAVNEVYSRHFASSKPARSTLAVASLPKNARVEIDAIAETV